LLDANEGFSSSDRDRDGLRELVSETWPSQRSKGIGKSGRSRRGDAWVREDVGRGPGGLVDVMGKVLLSTLGIGLLVLIVFVGYEVRERISRHERKSALRMNVEAEQRSSRAGERGPQLATGEGLDPLTSETAPDSGDVSAEQDGSAPVTAAQQEMEAVAVAEAWAKPSKTELAEMAQRCEIRIDAPNVFGSEPPSLDSEQASILSLSPSERIELNATFSAVHSQFYGFVLGLYEEATHGNGQTERIPVSLMIGEIENLAGDEMALSRQKMAREAAGIEAISPPVFPSPLSERLLVQWSHLGDEFERLLSIRLGPQRARQLRYSPKAASWMQRSAMGGCPAP